VTAELAAQAWEAYRERAASLGRSPRSRERKTLHLSPDSLPRRSIEWVRPTDGGVDVLCDCATITELRFDADAAPLESAFTCGGCLTVHWFTVTAVPEGGPA
jgi:hypothetical protein